MLTQFVGYKGLSTTSNSSSIYDQTSEGEYKPRCKNHAKLFRHQKAMRENLKDHLAIQKKYCSRSVTAQVYSKSCDLCLLRKGIIIWVDLDFLLNKKLNNCQCCYKNKFC